MFLDKQFSITSGVIVGFEEISSGKYNTIKYAKYDYKVNYFYYDGETVDNGFEIGDSVFVKYSTINPQIQNYDGKRMPSDKMREILKQYP